MKQTRIQMGMPVTVELLGRDVEVSLEQIYEYFEYVDSIFSTYREDSEISMYNKKKIRGDQLSPDVQEILRLSDATKRETRGYFDIYRDGHCDPSGLVKGWAIQNAAQMVRKNGVRNFYIEAGGDIHASGYNQQNTPWRVGIRNPFKRGEIVKALSLKDAAIATSGTYLRGQHIYDPISKRSSIDEIVSLTVIGPTIYDADRYATAAFAMGRAGIEFVESIASYEGYMIDSSGRATFTSGFEQYLPIST